MSNRNKAQLIINNKYLYNFYISDKKGNKSYSVLPLELLINANQS